MRLAEFDILHDRALSGGFRVNEVLTLTHVHAMNILLLYHLAQAPLERDSPCARMVFGKP